MKTITVEYGPKRKLPKHPGDTDPATIIREIHAIGGEDWEAAMALDKLGFHVGHPVLHPNGSGGMSARVFLPTHCDLPRTVTY